MVEAQLLLLVGDTVLQDFLDSLGKNTTELTQRQCFMAASQAQHLDVVQNFILRQTVYLQTGDLVDNVID